MRIRRLPSRRRRRVPCCERDTFGPVPAVLAAYRQSSSVSVGRAISSSSAHERFSCRARGADRLRGRARTSARGWRRCRRSRADGLQYSSSTGQRRDRRQNLTCLVSNLDVPNVLDDERCSGLLQPTDRRRAGQAPPREGPADVAPSLVPQRGRRALVQVSIRNGKIFKGSADVSRSLVPQRGRRSWSRVRKRGGCPQ